jgi:O-antigen ligase
MQFYAGYNKYYSYFLVLIVFVLWACKKMMKDEFSLDYSKFLIGFILLFYFVLIATALNGGLTYQEVNSIVRYAFFFSLTIIIYDMYKPKYTVPILVAITIPFIVSSFFVFFKFASVGGFFDLLHLYRMKPAGIFSNANAFGAASMFAAPFWIALAVWIKNRYARVIFGSTALILILSIFLSNSRSAILGLLFAIIFFSIIGKKIKHLIAIVAALVVLFAASPLVRIVSSVGLRLERGSSSRVVIWENSLEIFKENFVFGIGSGNFGPVYSPYLNTTFDRGFMEAVAHAHNEILHTAVEFGIAGLILIVVLFYVPFKKAFTLLKKPLHLHERAVVYGLIGILFANLGNCLFDANTMLSSGGLYPPLLYWIVIIMILKLTDKYQGRGSYPETWKLTRIP